MPLLAAYDGITPGIAQAVHEYNQGYRRLTSPRTRLGIREIVIDNVEARLYSIVRSLNTQDLTDRRWLIANRREIFEMITEFSTIREQLRRDRNDDAQMQEAYERLRANLRRDLLNQEEDQRYSRLVAKFCAGVAGGVGVVVTGASAGSFAAGPIVGGAVTGGVALASGVTTAIAAGVGYKVGHLPSEIPMEDMIREPYAHTRPIPG